MNRILAIVVLIILSAPSFAQDAIRNALSTSLSAYDASSTNNLVEITEAEFSNLQASITGASFVGYDPATSTFTHPFGGDFTEVLNQPIAEIPANKVLIGFYVQNIGTPNMLAPRLASIDAGTATVEIAIPDYNLTNTGDIYFTVKEANQSVPVATYLGIHRTNGIGGTNVFVPDQYYWDSGDAATVSRTCPCGNMIIYGIYADASSLIVEAAEPVPTLSVWALLAMTLIMTLLAFKARAKVTRSE